MTTTTRALSVGAELSARREYVKQSVAADWAMTAASDPEAATGERPHARLYARDCLGRMIAAGRDVLSVTTDPDEATELRRQMTVASRMIDCDMVFSVRGGKRAPIPPDAVPAIVGGTGIKRF